MLLARTADDVRRAHQEGKIAALIGIEGGHMLGNDIRMVRIYSDLGVRYIPLPISIMMSGQIPSTDKPAHNGLTDYGREIVREMNRQGMMVDISHVSDKTFYDALQVSKAPLIASHSILPFHLQPSPQYDRRYDQGVGRERWRYPDQLRKEFH